MKKMLLLSPLALLITGCAQQAVYCSKQAGSNEKPSPIIFFDFWNWAENCRCSQNLWRKILLKQKPSKHSVKWIAQF